MKDLILESKKEAVYLDEINDSSIIGVQFKQSRGLLIKVNQNEFRSLSSDKKIGLSLANSYGSSSKKDLVLRISQKDISFQNFVVFEDQNKALIWLSDFN